MASKNRRIIRPKTHLLEKEHRIKVILLDLPKLLFKRRKRRPRLVGNKDRPRVILGIARSILFLLRDRRPSRYQRLATSRYVAPKAE